MLHKDAFLISPETLDLIVKLQRIPELKDFHLVGGTALTLQIGHRNSIDIDLFTNSDFQTDRLLEIVTNAGFEIDVQLNVKSTIIGFIEGIKVDFIRHDYPLIYPPIETEGIRMLSCQDIAAMKLNAIVNSGQRLKDFIDIYFLLERFSLDDMIGYYALKYPKFNRMIALKAVSYFDEIDPLIDPPKMINPLPLDKIKKRIQAASLHSRKRF